MSDLVMRLETAAGKLDQAVRQTLGYLRMYSMDAADLRDLLQEAARRIKQLEQAVFRLQEQRMGRHADAD